MKIWIVLVCVYFFGVSAQSNEDGFPAYWEDDYEDQWYQDELEGLGIVNNEKDAPEDTNEANDYVGRQEQAEQKIEEESVKSDDTANDYQVEDNRSEPGEKVEIIEEGKAELIHDHDDANNMNDEDLAYDDYNGGLGMKNYDELDDVEEKKEVEFSKDDEIAPLPLPPQSSGEFKEILEETEDILNEEEQQPNDFENNENIAQDSEQKEEDQDLTDIIDETKQILSETNDQFDENQKSEQIDNSDQESPEIVNVQNNKDEDKNNEETLFDNVVETEEDNLDKAYQDLNDDLDTLFETLNKLANSDEDDVLVDYAANSDEIIDLRDDYENVFDSNLSDIFAKHSKAMEEVKELSEEKIENEPVDEEIVPEEKIENEPIDKEVLQFLEQPDTQDQARPDIDDALNNNKDNVSDDVEPVKSVITDEVTDDESDEYSKSNSEEVDEEVVLEEKIENEPVDEEVLPENNLDDIPVFGVPVTRDQARPYIDDALNNNKDNVSDDVEPVKSVNTDELTDDELDKLMLDFETQHRDAFNVAVDPEHHIVNEITLEYGKELVIESENYPSGYPTNRIVDWIIYGKGVGIELNVTDFAVNSALGDYLMIKPGQDHEGGPDGLIFAYHLNEPRGYRFMDVDKLFLRFDAKNGFSFLRGFSLSLSMIEPLPSEPEPEPEPEPLLPEAHSTLAVYLGGVTLEEFRNITEDFRLLVADMATMYINAKGIKPGINTTTEITQITSAYVCNIHWPGYDQCVQARIAVPLVYEESEGEGKLSEQQLGEMWNTYVATDPFASRLRRMGIEEFTVPSAGALTAWLVLAACALVAAALLALALWRYSCFKGYSRMPAFSDTDSLNKKASLDLYPTPHQTLPPLYSSEYKWDNNDDSTKVDMGGFANRSYVRTDMYDMESDDEVAPRDRNAGIQPRDIYNV